MWDYITRYIVAYDQPFNYVENEILEYMMQNSVQLVFRIIPRSTLMSEILKNYELIKLKVFWELNNFNDIILITSDLWTTTNQDTCYI